jgi:hypothetical protein
MGIVRSAIAVGMMGLSFYAGYKYSEMKPATVIERRMTIEDRIKSLMSEDKEQILKALYRVGKEDGYEK